MAHEHDEDERTFEDDAHDRMAFEASQRDDADETVRDKVRLEEEERLRRQEDSRTRRSLGSRRSCSTPPSTTTASSGAPGTLAR
jgi:hypothetical protein